MVTTNEKLQTLISALKRGAEEKNSRLLSRIAHDLEKPTRQRREVNLSRIDKFTKDNETIVVPGKVLGGGSLNHKLTISAFKFSESARVKIEQSGSKIIPFEEFIKTDINGKRVRIIG